MAALSITLRQGVCPRAQTRPTRLLHPDGLTRPEYQLTRPTMNSAMMNNTIMNSNMQRMTSALCNDDISKPLTSQHTCQHSGTHCHISSRELSQAKPHGSRAKPRAEGNDSVQQSLRATGSEIESEPLIRPELF